MSTIHEQCQGSVLAQPLHEQEVHHVVVHVLAVNDLDDLADVSVLTLTLLAKALTDLNLIFQY